MRALAWRSRCLASGTHLMDEQTIQRCWQGPAYGDRQVSGLRQPFKGNYEKFFTEYDRIPLPGRVAPVGMRRRTRHWRQDVEKG